MYNDMLSLGSSLLIEQLLSPAVCHMPCFVLHLIGVCSLAIHVTPANVNSMVRVFFISLLAGMCSAGHEVVLMFVCSLSIALHCISGEPYPPPCPVA